MIASKRALICDLDNTLYDWVGYFVPAFYAMVDAAVAITGCEKEKLLNDFRKVHQLYSDSEQPFALLETDTIKDLYHHLSARDKAAILDAAFHAFNSSRQRNLRLYPGVQETLDTLRRSDITLIAHTESKLFGVLDRLTRLQLFPYFKRVYCLQRSDSLHPNPDILADWVDRFPTEKVIELSHHQRKPDPQVLLEICARENINPSEVAYVGDSIARDISMAKAANVFSIWAAYGTRHDPAMYEALIRVSHWNEADIQRERKLNELSKNISPDYTTNIFSEVLPAINAHSTPELSAR
jgi:FMN phosphatase YigB (HAD superfamily)